MKELKLIGSYRFEKRQRRKAYDVGKERGKRTVKAPLSLMAFPVKSPARVVLKTSEHCREKAWEAV